MTVSAFDPMCFGQYPKDQVPLMLHFEFEGCDDVYRYIQVERIPRAEIDAATRRKKGEDTDAASVMAKYLPPKVVAPSVVAEPVVKPIKKKISKRSK